MWVWISSLTLLGMIVGFGYDYSDGVLWGGCIGFLAGMSISLHKRVNLLTKQVTQLSAKVFHTGTSLDTEVSDAPEAKVKTTPESETGFKPGPEPEQITSPARVVSQTETQFETQNHQPVISTTQTPATEKSVTASESESSVEPVPILPPILDVVSTKLRQFFTEGNVVLKVGLVVLFFGVAFLLKYAAERNVLTIEMRLVSVMIGALVMLVLGWRWREQRMMYGLSLQGGAIGIMFITVFVAAKIYSMIPLLLALVVMLGLVGFCAALAILQNSMWLAILGIMGGFLAPVLASTGTGNHVMLFGYYALLNLGIFAIAWYKSWRVLNLLGFVFTLLVGGLWAESSYKPELFATTEPFLIFFFLLFTAIAVIYALRQPPDLKGVVDASLVFGVPVVAFGLQSVMVSRFEYGTGFSALAMGAFYIALATVLWRRKKKQLQVLTESFLALGVVFASLAIPLTLSGSWTSMAWALEGAAITWVGVKQQRLLARYFGLLLQMGAGLALFNKLVNDYVDMGTLPFLNDLFIGTALVAIAGLFSAWLFYRSKEKLQNREQGFDIALLVWGVFWWLLLGWNESDFVVGADNRAKVMLLFISVSCYLFYLAYRRLDWRHMVYPALLVIPYAFLTYLLQYSYHWEISYPLKKLGYLAWPVAIAASVFIIHGVKDVVRQGFINVSALLLFWLVTILLVWQAGWIIKLIDGHGHWSELIELVTVVVIAWFVIHRSSGSGYDYFGITQRTGLLISLSPVMLYITAWIFLGSLFYSGETTLIPYMPVLNPFGLGVTFGLLVMLYWSWQLRKQLPEQAGFATIFGYVLVPLLAFVALNSSLARAMHQWTGYPYEFDAMLNSVVFQASVSILWTVLAMVITMMASRWHLRLLWFVGMSLMGLVIVKLFLFDLSNTNTLARVVSFLGVGLLMLVMGYFSPIPPRREETA